VLTFACAAISPLRLWGPRFTCDLPCFRGIRTIYCFLEPLAVDIGFPRRTTCRGSLAVRSSATQPKRGGKDLTLRSFVCAVGSQRRRKCGVVSSENMRTEAGTFLRGGAWMFKRIAVICTGNIANHMALIYLARFWPCFMRTLELPSFCNV
jgi:hypothetical protein